MGNHAIAVIVAVLLVTVAVVIVSADGDGPTAEPTMAPSTGSPYDLAAATCRHLLGTFADQIRTDAPADDVLDGLARAEAQAQAAADEAPEWIALAGAVGAVRRAIETDDPSAAQIGMRVVTSECDRMEP